MFGSAIFAVFLVFIGGFFTYAAVIQYNKRVFLNKVGLLTDGVVIRLEQDNDPDSSSWYPVVRFTTLTHETVTARHNFGSYPAAFRVGQRVQIRYDPLAPNEFVIGAGSIDWDAYCFGLFGVFLLCMGLYECFKSYF